MNSRRRFIRIVSLSSVALAAVGPEAFGQAAMVDPKDPTAVALGYVPDNTQADQKKYPNRQAGQMCGNCQLFQGAAGAASGPCPLYAGKQVMAKGWCSAYSKKP